MILTVYTFSMPGIKNHIHFNYSTAGTPARLLFDTWRLSNLPGVPAFINIGRVAEALRKNKEGEPGETCHHERLTRREEAL